MCSCLDSRPELPEHEAMYDFTVCVELLSGWFIHVRVVGWGGGGMRETN
jgi:hypothetical protein